MMKKRMSVMAAGVAALSVVIAGAVLAGDKPSKADSTPKQAIAQEKAGHAGMHGGAGHGAMAGMRHGNGHPGMADGHAGKGGMKHGAMGSVSMLLNHLEKLDGKNAPADFDLTRHAQADADGDGQLTAEEWTGFAVEARARLLARLLKLAPQADANEDGNLSRSELEAFGVERAAEMRAHVLKAHPEADANGDGTLSKDEAHAFRGAGQGAGDGGCPFSCANGRGGECPFANGKGNGKDGRCPFANGKGH